MRIFRLGDLWFIPILLGGCDTWPMNGGIILFYSYKALYIMYAMVTHLYVSAPLLRTEFRQSGIIHVKTFSTLLRVRSVF